MTDFTDTIAHGQQPAPTPLEIARARTWRAGYCAGCRWGLACGAVSGFLICFLGTLAYLGLK